MFGVNSVASSQPRPIPTVRNSASAEPTTTPPPKVQNDMANRDEASIKKNISKPAPITPDPNNLNRCLTSDSKGVDQKPLMSSSALRFETR